MELKIHEDLWTLEFISEDSVKMNPEENVVNLGLTECIDHKIYIREGMDEATTRQTIIHELVHAFIFSFGYMVESEEAACNFFGSQGRQILDLANKIFKKRKDEGDKEK